MGSQADNRERISSAQTENTRIPGSHCDPTALAEAYLNQHWRYDDGNSPTLYILRSWQGSFFRYENGCYVDVSHREMKDLVTEYLQVVGRENRGSRIAVSEHLVNNILLCLRGTTGVHIPESTPVNCWTNGVKVADVQTLAFKNGLFVIYKGTFQAVFVRHTPDFFTLNKLPYEYDGAAKCPRWIAFLTDVMQNDREKMNLLQEWAGYILTPNLRLQKFLLCAGEGANGKSVFSEVIEQMVGAANCSHVTLAHFGDRFSLGGTLGKMLNATTESSGTIGAEAEAMLKAYTAGDTMTFERKYKDPIEAVPTAKIMIATNELPHFQDRSQAIWRRLLFVPFKKIYAEHEQNRHLAEDLCQELPGIFNWAFDGMKRLCVSGSFTEPKECREALLDYRCRMNPARIFLEENYAEAPSSEGVFFQILYKEYADWCAENGYQRVNAANFGTELHRVFPNIDKGKRRAPDGKRQSYYTGIRKREDPDDGDMHGDADPTTVSII